MKATRHFRSKLALVSLAVTAAILALSVGTVEAAINAVNSGIFGGSAPGATVSQSISVGAGADMLIVMTSAELGGLNGDAMTVTYGGVSMNLAVGNLVNSAIWYLDLTTPGISGTTVVVDMTDYGTRNGFAAGWVSIDGNLGAGDSIELHSTGTSAAQANTVDLVTTGETFNVVNFNGNNTSGTVTVNSPSPTVIYTDNNIGSARSAAAYEALVAAGTSTYQWTLTGGTLPNDYRRIEAAAFAVVAVPDTTPPTLAASAFVDNRGGGPINAQTLVTYTVSVSEDMDGSSVSAADFGNAGSATIMIGTVTETSSGVFSVPVTPTQGGALQLKINAGAVLTDVAGNPLDTTAAIVDNTTLTVAPAIAIVNTDAFWSSNNVSSYTKSFNAGAADKLILSAHHESGSNITSITYNSVPLTMIPGSFADKRANGIWYLDDPYAGGAANIVVTLDGVGAQMGLGIASIIGSVDGYRDVATGGQTNNLTVTEAGSFVYAGFAANGGGFELTSDAPLTRIAIDGYDSMAADAGYEIAVSGGVHVYHSSKLSGVGTPSPFYSTAASFKPATAFEEGSVFRFR